MNYCNFAKVLIARNTKDPQSIEWWNLFSSDQQKKWASNSLPPSSSSFNNIIVPKKRYEFYTQVMHKYPKMCLPYNKFVRQIPRLQNYLTKNVYYKNSNKAGEKKRISKSFFSAKLVHKTWWKGKETSSISKLSSVWISKSGADSATLLSQWKRYRYC